MHVRRDVVSRVNVCRWCVIHNVTRVSYFSSSSSVSLLSSHLCGRARARESVLTEKSLTLGFLGAGLRLIPRAGQRAGRGGREVGRRIFLGKEAGGEAAVRRAAAARALRSLGPVDHRGSDRGSGVAQTQHLALPLPSGG